MWNWQQKDWTKFRYKTSELQKLEIDFIQHSGLLFGAYKHINNKDKETLNIELISNEALKTSEIEGEYLNRDSLQSSIRRNFGLTANQQKSPPAEQGIADMMVDLYNNFAEPLTHNTLFNWHKMLTNGRQDLQNIGQYREHKEPMQVVSGNMFEPKVHFEAPPSEIMQEEMTAFIEWFNNSAPNGKTPLSALTRAGIAHLYFVCIHPFEDGNGRIARALSEKALSQCLEKPTLIALSTIIQNKKKIYYDTLEISNKNNEITDWLIYFSDAILEAQSYTMKFVDFLIEKTKLYDRLRGQLNTRQGKVLTKMFSEGINGFKGGLSAENYISITKTSRATATRDLHDLVNKEALKKTGQLKNTRYWLSID